jgi:RND family efflux transporter MFP subunit
VQVDVEKGLITLSPDAQKSLGLKTTPVEQRALMEKALAYAGLVTPWQQQHFVSSQLSGRIAALHVVTGETVVAGQLLAEIASPELEVLQLELRNAANELDLSSRQVQRLKALAEENAIAGKDYIEANVKHEQNKNAVQIARSKLRSLGLDESAIGNTVRRTEGAASLLLPLVSPIGGIVSHSDLAIGKVIAANEHLFEINDLSKLWVKIGVLERDIARVKAGQLVELEFSAYRKHPVEAVVTVPCVDVDPVTHVGTAWAEIINPSGKPKYLPGMSGTAKIVTSEPTKLLAVPTSAILGSGAERYVLVEVAATSKGYEYRRQNIVLAAQNATFAQVRAGSLFPGDRVVTVGGQVLSSFFILGSLRLSPEGIRNVGLKVEPATKRVVEDVRTLDGLIDLPPGRVATVSSQLVGTLSRIHVDRGARVVAGQTIAEVAGLPLQDTQLEMLRADLDAKLLLGTLERIKSVGQTPIVAVRRIWETETAHAAAENRRESARQTLMTLGMTSGEVDEILVSGTPKPTLPIRSPIDGVVVRFERVLGESVANDEPLFEIHDLSGQWAKAFLSEREAASVRIDTPARVRLLSDPSFVAEGRVVQSARMVGVENRTMAAWIEFASHSDKPLHRNLLARITATISQPEATLAVPISAVVSEGTSKYLFIQKEGGLLERKSVDLGRSDDRFVEVRTGLTVGEKVAVQGTAELQTTYASVR